MKTFTEEQLENWRAYEEVRSEGNEGNWNMWSPQAREATGLTKDEYLYVMENFDALKKAVKAAKHENWKSP